MENIENKGIVKYESSTVSIPTLIAEAIDHSNAIGSKVSIEIYDVEMIVDGNDDPRKIYEDYIVKESLASDERYAKEMEEKTGEFIRTENYADANVLKILLDSVDKIDFTDLEQVLRFLSELTVLGHPGELIARNHYNRVKIKDLLRTNGYSETVDIGEAEINDREASGKWLVGQYMTSPNIKHFVPQVNLWFRKFAVTSMEDQRREAIK